MIIENVKVTKLHKDKQNPRKSDEMRMTLLRLSIAKLGFILPVCATESGMLLSGHQRLTTAANMGIDSIPVQYVDLSDKDIKGINVLFNRATNDFSAFDTGSTGKNRLEISDVIAEAEQLPDFDGEDWDALHAEVRSIKGLGQSASDSYDKKAAVIATNLLRKNIRIPIVISESGKIINGVHRLFSAREAGVEEWPIIEIPDDRAEVALHFLNYLSMDYHVDGDFGKLLRYSAYRRPQNNRGAVPKAYRFWANGERTLLDKDSYTTEYWRKFRDLHGHSIIDFGGGRCKVAPYLRDKGIDCIDFEPYRIDPEVSLGFPDPDFSKKEAKRFLNEIGDGREINSIFLASVLNSIPFPQDRMAVLAIVHGLCNFNTEVYGTCRDISDFTYEYGGIRNANYFVFDSEPGVRLGDSLSSPKIQKFHSQEEAQGLFNMLWNTVDFWPGGNIFYFRLRNPKRVNPKVLAQALDIEFQNLPYSDGTTMGLGKLAKKVFSARLGRKV